MPWGDRTGPMGFGPMTGRAAGYCAGYLGPGYMNVGALGFGGGRGGGFGRGFGRGRGWWGGPYVGTYYPPASYYPRYHPEYYSYYGPAPYYSQSETSTMPAAARESERTYLEERIRSIEDELHVIQQRLQELSEK